MLAVLKLVFAPKAGARDEAYKRFVLADGISALCATMRTHTELPWALACLLLLVDTYCAFDPQRTIHGGDLLHRQLGTVVAAMLQHPASEDVQNAGCTILARHSTLMTTHKTDTTKTTVSDHLDTLFAAMRRHPGAALVQGNALQALAYFVRFVRTGTERVAGMRSIVAAFRQAGGLALVVAALRAHQASPFVRSMACWLLSMLCNDTDLTAELILAGAPALALASLQHSDANSYGLFCAAMLVSCLAQNNEPGIAAILAGGGIAALLAALQVDFPAGQRTHHVRLEQNAWNALQFLMGKDAQCEDFVLHGGVALLLRALTAFGSAQPDTNQLPPLFFLRRLNRLSKVRSVLFTLGASGVVQGLMDSVRGLRGKEHWKVHTQVAEVLVRLAGLPALRASMPALGLREWLLEVLRYPFCFLSLSSANLALTSACAATPPACRTPPTSTARSSRSSRPQTETPRIETGTPPVLSAALQRACRPCSSKCSLASAPPAPTPSPKTPTRTWRPSSSRPRPRPAGRGSSLPASSPASEHARPARPRSARATTCVDCTWCLLQ